MTQWTAYGKCCRLFLSSRTKKYEMRLKEIVLKPKEGGKEDEIREKKSYEC